MQKFMETIIHAIKSWVNERIKNSKANWNENNPEADSYIKNRTHWTEDPVENVLVAEQTIEGFAVMEEPIYAVENPFFIQLKPNQTYTVTWDGVTYNLEYQAIEPEFGFGYLGNENYIDMQGGGDIPFAVVTSDGMIFVVTESAEVSHTISIKTIDTQIHQLDPKYIKDMYYEYLAPNNDEVMWEHTVTTEDDYYRADVEINSPLVEDATYIVTWNGTEYTCTARKSGYGEIFIGNQAVALEDGWGGFTEVVESNEPFFFYTYDGDYGLLVQTAGEYTVSIRGTGEKLTPRKIDMKYMPYRITEDLEWHSEEIENLYDNIFSVRTTANTANTTANSALTKANTAQSTANNALTTDAASMSIPFINCADIAYGNGKFVVVRESNVVAYSEDGINWIQTSIPFNGGASIAYGNGKFVVVNGYKSNTAAYSEDGVNWTETSMPSTDNWYHITYGDSKFVAIGGQYQSSAAAYSEDGVNWTGTTMPSSKMWTDITYGDGKFVAISKTSNTAAYSEDGVNWTETSMPSSKIWTGITYGNGKFVAISSSSNTAAYSEDGVNWTGTTMPSTGGWHVVTYGGGKFVAVCTSSSNTAAYSEDGVNWTQTTMPLNNTWGCIIYKNGKFIVISAESNIACSKDGINWTNTYDIITKNDADITEQVRDIILRNKPVTEEYVANYTDEKILNLTTVEGFDSVIVKSSTEGSTKKFKLAIDDSGTLSATEIIE